jgi:hypothetical protein
LGSSTGKFEDYFLGFERSAAVQGIFGGKTEEVLANLKVQFVWFGYMGVSDQDGHLMVNKRWLETGDKTELYLDVVHELCHVKQHMEGKHLFNTKVSYVDSPTEVEAYRYTVQEAKRIGLGDERILTYLQTEWMSDEDLRRLVSNMGIPMEFPKK